MTYTQTDVNASIAYQVGEQFSHKSNFAPGWELKYIINHKEICLSSQGLAYLGRSQTKIRKLIPHFCWRTLLKMHSLNSKNSVGLLKKGKCHLKAFTLHVHIVHLDLNGDERSHF